MPSPRASHRSHVVGLQYWLGPFLGALLGSGFYTLLKQYALICHDHSRLLIMFSYAASSTGV